MIYYIFDDNIKAFYSAVFDAYKNRCTDVFLTAEKEIQIGLTDNICYIEQDEQKFERINNFIKKTLPFEVLDYYYAALFNCSPDKYNKTYLFLCEIFKNGAKVAYMHNLQVVIDFYDIAKKVKRESHRMKGFIKFKECQGNIFYARFTPDHKVITLIKSHFINRFGSMKFILHDTRHNSALLYDGKDYIIIEGEYYLNPEYTEAENRYIEMWKNYRKAITIKQRTNIALMRRFMPVRYNKFMEELHRDTK